MSPALSALPHTRPGPVPDAVGAGGGAGGRRWAAAGVLGALWAVLCWRLGAVWSVDEQYGYGWFVPLFAVVLGFLRWEDRPAPGQPVMKGGRRGGGAAWVIGAVVLGAGLLAPLRLFENANPDWRVLGWVHAGVLAGLTLAAFGAAGGWPWVRWMAFPVGFFLVGVPWVRSVEEGVIQTLMRGVAVAAAEGLQLMGTPARVEGNLLRVGTGTLGVNEACSGVRSLQTSLMIGLLLGELGRLTLPRRVALVLGAAALAVGANVIRALTLAVIAARHGLAAAERGHDAAGWVILGLVFAGTLGLAAWLRPRGAAAVTREEAHAVVPPGRVLPLGWVIGVLAWSVTVEAGVEGWYRWHERDLTPQTPWTVRWPTAAPGFRTVPVDERTERILHCDKGVGAAWREGAAGRCQGYFFSWSPGRNSPLLASAHRPDVCLPAAGWEAAGDDGVRLYPAAPGLELPFRHFRFTRKEGAGSTAHVFYCLWEDRAAPGNAGEGATEGSRDLGRDPREGTYAERWLAVREGRRHLGQRVLELAFLDVRPEVPAEAVRAVFGQRLRDGLVVVTKPPAP